MGESALADHRPVQAHRRFTDAADGDFAVDGDPAELARRRAAICDAPWTWLRQVHGADVVGIERPGEHAGVAADAAVTSVAGAALAVHTADCVPLLLAGPGAVGAVHAGWRGLAGGVVGATVEAMAQRGAAPGQLEAWIGPCIRARCYEFSAEDLDRVAGQLGEHVRGQTAWGTPALDLVAGVRADLAAAGVTSVADGGVCTACSPVHYSYRARGDRTRHAAVVWLDAAPA